MDKIAQTVLEGREPAFADRAEWFLSLKGGGEEKRASVAGRVIGAGVGGALLGSAGYRRYKADRKDPPGLSGMERGARKELEVLDRSGDAGFLHGLKRKWVQQKIKGVEGAKKRPGLAAVPWGIMGAGAGAVVAKDVEPLVRRLLLKRASAARYRLVQPTVDKVMNARSPQELRRAFSEMSSIYQLFVDGREGVP